MPPKTMSVRRIVTKAVITLLTSMVPRELWDLVASSNFLGQLFHGLTGSLSSIFDGLT